MTISTLPEAAQSAFAELVDILSPREVAPDLYRGAGSSGDGAAGTFGGHFLGQATAAASATVGTDRALHSIHGRFLKGGEPRIPIDYRVERIRDGRSFSIRRVQASQGAATIFELTASFTTLNDGREIAADPPADFDRLPAPETLPRYPELMGQLDPPALPAAWALREHGIDVRVVNAPWSPNGPSDDGGIRMWIRANGELPERSSLHASALAYQSDESIADNVLIPFGLTWGSPGVFFVSLDHALWIHRPVNLNRWHFVDQRPVTAAGGRGTSSATVWDGDGSLIASFCQEALMVFDE